MPPSPERRSNSPKPFTPGKITCRPWHGGDPFYKRLRLKDMHRNGYIDYPGGWPGIEDDFQVPDPSHALHDNSADTTATTHYTFIHPVFRRLNWLNVSDDEYEAFTPALRLASSILCTPHVLRFYQALLHRPLDRLNDPQAEARLGARYHVFGVADLTNQDLTDTHLKLNDMADCVMWDFSHHPDMSEGVDMITTHESSGGIYPDGAIPDRTSAAHVHIRESFRSALLGRELSTSFAKAASFDARTAHCRALWFFAIVLLHELAHATHLAYWELFPDRYNPTTDGKEPFWRDDRLAELGWAFTQVVFGAVFHPFGFNPYSASLPYGMAQIRWPGGSNLGDARGSALGWAHAYMTRGATDVHWCHKFFTRRFWEVDVPARGAHAMAAEWKVAVQYMMPFASLFPGETPLLNPPGPPSPGIPPREEIEARGFKFKQMLFDLETSDDTDDSD